MKALAHLKTLVPLLAVCGALLSGALPAAIAVPTLLAPIDLSPGTDAVRPNAFTLNATSHKLYVQGINDLTHVGVKVIDTTSGTAIGGINLADYAPDSNGSVADLGGVGADESNNRIYVGLEIDSYNASSCFLRFIDGATDTSLTGQGTDLALPDIAAYGNILANSVRVNPVTHKVYVNDGYNHVTVVDGPGQTILSEITLPVTGPYATVVDRTNNQLFFIGSNGVAILDGNTDIATAVTVPFQDTVSAAVDEADGLVFVFAFNDQYHETYAIYTLDATSGAVLNSTSTGVPYDTQALVFDPASGTLYGSEGGDSGNPGNITAYDPATFAVKSTLPYTAYHLAVDGGRLFLLGEGGNVGNAELPDAVGVLDPATGILSKTTVAYFPAALAVNPQTGRVYVYDEVVNEVPVFDTTTGAVVVRFPVADGSTASGTFGCIAVSSAVNHFYLTHQATVVDDADPGGRDGTFLDVYDGDSGQLLQSQELGENIYSEYIWMTVDDVHHLLYATGTTYTGTTGTNVLFVYNIDTDTFTATIPLGTQGYGVAVNPVTRRVYVSGTGGLGMGQVTIIDGAANTLVTTVTGVGSIPTHMAVNTVTDMVYVQDGSDGTVDGNNVYVIDGAADSFGGVFTNTTQNGSDAVRNVAVDEATNTIYLADNGNGNTLNGFVTFFDGNAQDGSYPFLGQVAVGLYPQGIVFDPTTRRLFVSVDHDGTVSALQEVAAPPPTPTPTPTTSPTPTPIPTAAPVITSAFTANAQVGASFTYQITATNNPTSFGASDLPDGLSVDSQTGIISGTPTQAGSVSVTIDAGNSYSFTYALLYLTISGSGMSTPTPTPESAPVITSSLVASGQVGVGFTYQITASNDPTSFSATGLPDGLVLDPVSGVISGTPAGDGAFTVALAAANATGTGTASLALTVVPAAATTPPTIAITSPPADITVAVGVPVTLAASVNDPSGVLAQVQFFVNGLLVATKHSNGPFTATAAPPFPGTYVITAIATDTQGNTNTNTVTVTAFQPDASDPAPTSDLLTPLNGRDLLAGSTLSLIATADSAAAAGLDHVSIVVDGATVATFDAQGNLLSSVKQPAARSAVHRTDASTTPFSKLFTTSYQMPALDKIINMIVVATDKLGHTTVSPVTSFHSKVTTDRAPQVSFSNLSANIKVAVGSSNVANVTASDPDLGTSAAGRVVRADASADGVLSELEYFINGQSVGMSTAAPFTFNFTPPSAGKYVLHAVATDGSGLAAVSDPVVVEADATTPVVTVAVTGDGQAVEGGANAKVAVRRTGDTSAALTVRYKVKGSAVAGVDYKPLTGVATIPAGAAQVKIKIKPVISSTLRGTTVAKLKLLPSTDGSYTLGTTDTSVKVKIIDNP